MSKRFKTYKTPDGYNYVDLEQSPQFEQEAQERGLAVEEAPHAVRYRYTPKSVALAATAGSATVWVDRRKEKAFLEQAAQKYPHLEFTVDLPEGDYRQDTETDRELDRLGIPVGPPRPVRRVMGAGKKVADAAGAIGEMGGAAIRGLPETTARARGHAEDRLRGMGVPEEAITGSAAPPRPSEETDPETQFQPKVKKERAEAGIIRRLAEALNGQPHRPHVEGPTFEPSPFAPRPGR